MLVKIRTFGNQPELKKEILKEIDRKIKSAGPQYIYFPSNIDRHSSKFLNKLQNIK